ncbi:MAG TPA: hypothetical protein VL737_00890 [Candidatus Pristimantibacillus sp.]|nr:hypothetical protein [Candidatus Pristimantibacillus sp.]
MSESQYDNKESGIVFLALFALIIIAIVIAAFMFVAKRQHGTNGKTQININNTINL